VERGGVPYRAIALAMPHLEHRAGGVPPRGVANGEAGAPRCVAKEDSRAAARISAALLRWFRTAARPMAWRETRDPYRIWVSEIMLQQTRVETVAPYYERFLRKFPDVRSLARAPLDDVLKAWEGLGYYSRARNIHRAAGVIVAQYDAKVPRTVEALEALPGIGRSTAGAIAAIAFGADVPILDANARRVVARLFAVEGDLRSSAAESLLWERSASLVRKGKGRDTALAVMDLGAVVCLPHAPRCGECPLGSRCSSFLRGVQDSIPPKRAKKALPHRDVVAAVFRRADGALFLMRRPPDGLLGGLWAFPSGRRDPGETLEEALRRFLREKLRVRAVIQREVGAVRHAYSHYRITLHGFLCGTRGSALPAGEGTGWLPGHDEGAYALPRADRKLVENIHREEGR
jgi:A/G-specific adenine glycosylase